MTVIMLFFSIFPPRPANRFLLQLYCTHCSEGCRRNRMQNPCPKGTQWGSFSSFAQRCVLQLFNYLNLFALNFVQIHSISCNWWVASTVTIPNFQMSVPCCREENPTRFVRTLPLLYMRVSCLLWNGFILFFTCKTFNFVSLCMSWCYI